MNKIWILDLAQSLTTLLCWYMRWCRLILVKSPHTSLLGNLQYFIIHIQPRSYDHSFPIPLWETWFCQSLGVPIPALLENRQCPCRQFNFDHYGDQIQTCQCQSSTLPAHEWIVYRLSLLLHSVGHRVKTHRSVSRMVYWTSFRVVPLAGFHLLQFKWKWSSRTALGPGLGHRMVIR